MRLLAIETATPQSGVVLAEDREVVATAPGGQDGPCRLPGPGYRFRSRSSGVVPRRPRRDSGRHRSRPLHGHSGWHRHRPGSGFRPGDSGRGRCLPRRPALEAARSSAHLLDRRRAARRVGGVDLSPVPGGVVKSSEPELLVDGRDAALIMSDSADPLVVGDVAAIPDLVMRGLHRVRTGRPRFPSAGRCWRSVWPGWRRMPFPPRRSLLLPRARRHPQLGEAHRRDHGRDSADDDSRRPRAVLRIEEATYPTPWTEGIFRDELAAPGRVYSSPRRKER